MIRIYILTLVAILFVNTGHVKAQTVFTGPTITFTKTAGANPLLVANQDLMTNNVKLTRGNSGGLFNIVNEPMNNNACGLDNWPTGTEWAIGTTANFATLTYMPLGNLIGCGNFSSIVNNQDLVVHLIADDVYIDIKFTQWSVGSSGGFAYERSTSGLAPVTSTDTRTACDSFTWIDGVTYTANNNTATFTIPVGSYTFADSIVTLDLTINNSSLGTDVVSACNTYTWINGLVYTANNNTALHLLTGSNGCDSIVMLDLTIDTVDVATTTAGFSIIANLAGATYQWLDCTNGNVAIPGETNQSYTATASGDYAVEINNGCIDTSACVTIINTVGIREDLKKSTSVYPNPTNGIFTISLADINPNSSVIIYDVLGNVVVSKQLTLTDNPINLTEYDKGIYFVNIQTNNELIVKKVILQ